MKYEAQARQILAAMDNSKITVTWLEIDTDELIEVIAKEINKIMRLAEVSDERMHTI